MRLAIISDIHSNLEALEAVLAHIADQSVERVVCLGDIVGYGADPNPCCERIRNLTDDVVAGNHDHASIGLLDAFAFNPNARTAALWTDRMLLIENRKYLEKLKLTIVLPEVDATLVHSTPSRPEAWRYLYDPYGAIYEFDSFNTWCCFVGHTHSPGAFVQDAGGRVTFVPLDHISLQKELRYLINVGSVGQPRDGDPRASYLVFDTETSTCDLHRVEYDIHTAQKKITQAGLPHFLAERLQHGR